jgi:hypothetical protein
LEVSKGGGSNFLTHQGIDFLGRKKSIAEQVDPKWRSAKEALSWLNETGELVVRLAHRERMIKQGMDPEMATLKARDRLDFSQGGPVAKGLDTVIPFLNVSLQGYYKVAKQAQADPARFAAQAGQVALGVSSVVAANILLNLNSVVVLVL